jgi:hypothetical protein
MERIAADVEAFHLGLGDLDAFLVDPCVECALNFEPGLGRSRRDELDDGSACRSIMQTLVQRRAAPRNRPPPSHTVAVFTSNLDSLIVAAVLTEEFCIVGGRVRQLPCARMGRHDVSCWPVAARR